MRKMPPLPPGISPASFGQDIMKWGIGDAQAIARIHTLTKDELDAAGVTAEITRAWADFYTEIKAENENNPSAYGRIGLMKHATNLLEAEKS